MSPSEIRDELLEQHASLRAMIEDVRWVAGRAHESDGKPGELQDHMRRLALAFRAHNRREEEVLKGFLVSVDAWGPVREEIMSEEHVAEHVELYAALVDMNMTARSAIAAGALAAGLDRMLDHMAREEIAYLGEDVLRDDGVMMSQFSG
jgi:hemerythrin HHE cation binding domain-containing protein